MKKTIISTALKLIPKKIQNKALCKAINYTFAENDLSEFYHLTIKLNVSDIKRSWFVSCDENGFIATKSRNVDIEIKTKLNTALNIENKAFILDAIEKGNIEFKGEAHLIECIVELLNQLNEQPLVNLSQHLFSFLKIKKSAQPPRLDINTVQLSDLKSPLDVDFIRDEAVRLEKIDLEKALSLMLLAHQARPNGPFIAKKITAYREALQVQ